MYKSSHSKLQLMSKSRLQYGTTTIEYDLFLEERKTLGIKVYPDRRVSVTAPLDSSHSKIEEHLKKKAHWIVKQQAYFLNFEPRTPARRYISGETHLYLGKQYRLKVIESEVLGVKMMGGNLVVSLKDKNDPKQVEILLKKWYRDKADIHFERIYNENISIAQELSDANLMLQHSWMKKRWGSCTVKGTIRLNTELIKAPTACIAYVIIHEMCHLKHLNHSQAFFNLLASKLPDYEHLKNRLEQVMV